MRCLASVTRGYPDGLTPLRTVFPEPRGSQAVLLVWGQLEYVKGFVFLLRSLKKERPILLYHKTKPHRHLAFSFS